MTNGNVVFVVSRSSAAQSTTARACEMLRQACGLLEPVFVRSLAHIADLVSQDPFAEFTDEPIHERCISFVAPEAVAKAKPPLESKRGDCLVFQLRAGEAFSVTREIDGKSGYPTPLLERVLRVSATTRNWKSILRMLEKHA